MTNNRKMLWHELAIYAASFMSMVSVAVSPALASIAKEFSWASTTQIQMLVTLPALAQVPAAFISPSAQKKFSIKTLYIFNLCVALIFGIMPYFMNNYYAILATRAVVGFALGTIQILLSVTITTRFPEKDQGRVMGGRTFATSLGAIIISYIGGRLADIDWHLSFLPFIIALPVILITWAGMLRMPPLEEEVKSDEDKPAKKVIIDGITLFICLFTVFEMVFLSSFNTNISMYIDAEKFGTATISGVAVAIYNAAGLVCGFLMARMYRKFKGTSLFIGFMCSATGILMIGLARVIWLVYAGGFLAGFGLSALLGFGPMDITGTITKERASMAISWFAIAIFLGSFLTPYIVNPLTKLIDHTGPVRTRFVVSGVMLFVQAILYETLRRRKFIKYFKD